MGRFPKKQRRSFLLRRADCRQTPKHVIASRRERSPDRSASHRSIHGGIWGCLPTAWQSVLLQKSCIFKAFRLRIATPLFAFGKNADIGHSLQVLGDEGALELVRAFGRFAMTENPLCRQSEMSIRVFPYAPFLSVTRSLPGQTSPTRGWKAGHFPKTGLVQVRFRW